MLLRNLDIFMFKILFTSSTFVTVGSADIITSCCFVTSLIMVTFLLIFSLKECNITVTCKSVLERAKVKSKGQKSEVYAKSRANNKVER